jgi:hypothetical protein
MYHPSLASGLLILRLGNTFTLVKHHRLWYARSAVPDAGAPGSNLVS